MGWQDDLLEQLRVSEQPGGLVRVDATGSVAARLHDSWSELDVRLTVAAGAIGAFFPEIAWLERFGPVFCVDQRVTEAACETRVVFEDLRRLDIHMREEGTRLDQERWRHACDLLTADRAKHQPGDAFWFGAVLAVMRAIRDDVLGAANLALGLSQQCLVLALHLRDDLGRAVGNEWAARLLGEGASLAEPGGIFDHLSTTATLFEGLQRMAVPSYTSRRRPFDDLVRQARASVRQHETFRPRALNS